LRLCVKDAHVGGCETPYLPHWHSVALPL